MTILSTAEQRQRQFQWRPWQAMLESLPIPASDACSMPEKKLRTLDLGCGPGDMVRYQRDKFHWDAMGVDSDPAMLQSADMRLAPFLHHADVTKLSLDDLSFSSGHLVEQFDMIWSSFTVQYFLDDFAEKVLPKWVDLLKPGGLIAIVETDGLFQSHGPLPPETKTAFQEMEKQLETAYGYHTCAGSTLPLILLSECSNLFEIVSDTEWDDAEFSFQGSAAPEILQAWKGRTGRMKIFQQDGGMEKDWKPHLDSFLDCLAQEDHFTETKIRLIVAKKKSYR